MRKAVLYIAMSLDGYIARKDFSIDFLDSVDLGEEEGSYFEFYNSIDTVILGYNTYNQIVTELSDTWPYQGKTTYVLTSKEMKNQNEIIFVNQDVKELISNLKKEDGKNIWICGGASIVQQGLDNIDEYIISVIPIILGSGIKLFQNVLETKLKLISTKTYNGIIDLKYIRR